MSGRTKDDATEWVNSAISFYKVSGKPMALAEFTNPSGQFRQDEMYIYVLNLRGTMLANGVNERYVGEELLFKKHVYE